MITRKWSAEKYREYNLYLLEVNPFAMLDGTFHGTVHANVIKIKVDELNHVLMLTEDTVNSFNSYLAKKQLDKWIVD